MLLEPKEVLVDGKTFTISKFPAVAGREIVAKYVASGIPKVGDYAVNEEMMFKMMNYVSINGIILSTPALIDNHVGSWETCLKVEGAIMAYNCSFFREGRISTFFEDLKQTLPPLIIKTWTGLLELLSQAEKPRSENSKKTIP